MYRRSFFERFKNLDLFPKYVETASVKTEIGAFLTLLSYLFLILLFMNELFLFLTLKLETNLTIDDSRIHNQVAVHFNITFPRLSCKLLHIDALDHSGARHLNIKHDIFTIPLDRKGNRKEHHKPKKLDKLGNGRFFCGSCYDAEEFSQDGCCNTCKEIETAYRKKGLSFNANDFEICDKNLKKEMKYEKDDGCIIYGTLHVNKIAGIFHIAPGVNSIYEDQHYHIYETKDDEKKIDCSHYIDYLYFGKAFSETLYPLSNTKQEDKAKETKYQYFLKVVPTFYHQIETFQYSAYLFSKEINPEIQTNLPGLFFSYDFTPIVIQYEIKQKSFIHFITQNLSLLGGIYTVSYVIDRFIYTVWINREKKEK